MLKIDAKQGMGVFFITKGSKKANPIRHTQCIEVTMTRIVTQDLRARFRTAGTVTNRQSISTDMTQGLIRGEEVREPAYVDVLVNSKHEPDDFFPVGIFQFASEKLKEVVESQNGRVQFLPTRLTFNGSMYSKHKFYLINILERLDDSCIDLDSSNYEIDDEPGLDGSVLYHMEEIFLNDEFISDSPIFRIEGIDDVLAFCSDSFSQAAEDANATGAIFKSLSNYRIGQPKDVSIEDWIERMKSER